MTASVRPIVFGLLLAAAAALPAAAFAQDAKVYTKLSSKDLEQILTEMNIKFEKSFDPRDDERCHFSYLSKNQRVTLACFAGGTELTLQTRFNKKVALEKLNAWNDIAPYSRAYLGVRDEVRDQAVLERSLEVQGPVTAFTVKQFIARFDDEMVKFAKFIDSPLESPTVASEIKPLAPEVVKELTELERRMQALTEKIIPDDKTLIMTFPVGDEEWKTAWKVTWNISSGKNAKGRLNNFFHIEKAWFKTGPREPWLQVLGDARASELFAAYSDGRTRFHDMRDFSFPLIKINPRDVGIRGRVIGEKKNVAVEIRERGVLWAKSFSKEGGMRSRRAQEMVLWANLHAANYYYLIQYGFQDDGVVTFRVGATGHNLPQRTDVSHMHNSCWRVNVNLGGTGHNNVYLVRHIELPEGKGTAKQEEKLLHNEMAGEWNAKEFNLLRVKHQLPTADGKFREIAYDLIPMRMGSARHYGRNEEFTQFDYWVTPNAPGELYYYDLPNYLKKNQPPRPIDNSDVVLWYMSSALHIPRMEDGHMENGVVVMKGAPGVALAAWSGFDLKPRNVFLKTPIYP